ncbi:MAG: hypothetical protein U9Q24_01100 [Candidatus Ratteibacteria bacterium]|nr:hypothetical protein [Candidatus Ratteibacteria bacterium]
MISRIIAVMAIFLFVFSTTGYAQSNSLGVKISTLGLGLEAERSFSDSIGGRLGVNYLTYDYSGTEDDIEYDFELNLKSLSALLDWHPFQGSFRISGGAVFHGNTIDANAKSAETFDIGNSTYTGAQVGTLTGKIDFENIAPYLGIGCDTSFGKDKSFGFLFELGAIYQGSPKVALSADGPIATNAAFQNELAAEEKDLQSDLDAFKIYPVVAIGLSYRF